MDNKENNIEIAKKLKLLRNEQDMTQSEIAERLGVSQQTYSKYEKGISSPDSVTLKNICNLYGVTADYILGIENKTLGGMNSNEETAYVDKIVSQVIERMNKEK